MKKIILSTAIALLMANTLQAKECFDAQKMDVTWTSYKTMAKIGVGGDFSKVNLKVINKKAPTIESMLKGASVTLELRDIDAHLSLKNSNIAEFFTSKLDSKNIIAQIIAVDAKKMTLHITLNGITKTVPMFYTLKDSHIVAKGVIDAVDFELVPALRNLNKNVAGHKNKGWNDISIGFDMPYTNSCR